MPDRLGLSDKEGTVHLLLKIATLAAKAQRNPKLKKDGDVALHIYHEALSLTRQWLPVVEEELRVHSMLDGRNSGVRHNGDRALRTNRRSGFLGLAVKLGKSAIGVGVKSKNGGERNSSWRLMLMKKMHGVIQRFVEDAEGEVERLERLVERKEGSSRYRKHGESQTRHGRGVTGPSSESRTQKPSDHGKGSKAKLNQDGGASPNVHEKPFAHT